MDTLFKNATLLTMQGADGIIYNAYCGVSGERISYIGIEPPEEEPLRIIDCHGDIIMPGLINCHAHTAMTLLRGFSDDCTLNDWLFNHIFPAEAKLNERAVCAGFSLGMAEMLSTGTTSFIDMYFYQDKMAQLADNAGMRAMLCNAVIALSDDYDFDSDRAVKELYNMLSDATLSDRIRPNVGIHCSHTSPPEVWEKVLEIARKYKLPVHIHLSESIEDHERSLREHGKTPAQRFYEHGVFDMPCIAAHCVYVSEDDMRILAKSGATAVHNPVSNLKLASGIADICKLRRMGVNVALGTDGCSSNNTLDMFEDMKLAALLAKNLNGDSAAFTAYDAICLATVNGAAAMGLSDCLGQIKTGYYADLIRLDTKALHRVPMYDPYSSVVYCLGGNDVRLSMVAGKILYEDGRFTTLDTEAIMREVREYAIPLITGSNN